jgi:hypothetical protein
MNLIFLQAEPVFHGRDHREAEELAEEVGFSILWETTLPESGARIVYVYKPRREASASRRRSASSRAGPRPSRMIA